MNNKSERIKLIREEFCHGNNIEFSEKLGIAATQASGLCNGVRNPGPQMIEKILSVFPDVSYVWLMKGEGEMRKSPNSEQMNVDAAPHSTVNTISHTGKNSTNSINAGILNDMLMQMYEARLADKDDVISTLKDTIKALQGEVEQLRSYVKLTSTKYIEEIERMRQTTIDTHDIVKDCANHIGYSKK